MSERPLGRKLFTWVVTRRAPYFASISPTITELRIGRCAASMRKHRAVQNHIGTVHAIAMCNLCELVGGVLIEASLPKALRWIPKGMTVRYLKKAETDLSALAEWTPDLPDDFSGEVVLPVKVRNTAGVIVMEADISMYVSPKLKSA
ncbi:MAG: hotdog fold domain-containing protein [Nevskia sp.]